MTLRSETHTSLIFIVSIESNYGRYVQLERQSIEPHAWDSYIKKGDDRFSDETV